MNANHEDASEQALTALLVRALERALSNEPDPLMRNYYGAMLAGGEDQEPRRVARGRRQRPQKGAC